MRNYRWLGVALSVGLLTGCPAGLGLNPQTMDQINAFLGEYGLSLKTVDATTGEPRTFTESDVSQVVGEDGKPIEYKFEDGRLVFRPTKEGAQRITVIFKDDSRQQFTIEGKKADGRMSGDVAFIPDGSGQGFKSEVAIGGAIDVEARHDAFLQQMAAKRVTLTFATLNLPGLTPDSIRGVYIDRMKLQPFTYAVIDGALKVDPNHFFMAREYQARHGAFPLIRVAYAQDGKLVVVLAAMASLPELPAFTPSRPGEAPPPPPGPDSFKSGQKLDLEIKLRESLDKTLPQYEAEKQLESSLPKPGEAPPPPNQTEQTAIRDRIRAYGVTFKVPALAGVPVANVKAMFVGKVERPVAPLEPNQPPRPIDLLAIGAGGEVSLDSMMIGHAFQLWYGPLNQSGSDFPVFRIFYTKDNASRVAAFRFTSAPPWFTTPNATGWTAPAKPGDAPSLWMPPPPPFGSFGQGHVFETSDLEVADYSMSRTLDEFRQELRGKSPVNPDDDLN